MKTPNEVCYNKQYPPEFFDFIIIEVLLFMRDVRSRNYLEQWIKT